MELKNLYKQLNEINQYINETDESEMDESIYEQKEDIFNQIESIKKQQYENDLLTEQAACEHIISRFTAKLEIIADKINKSGVDFSNKDIFLPDGIPEHVMSYMTIKEKIKSIDNKKSIYDTLLNQYKLELEKVSQMIIDKGESFKMKGLNLTIVHPEKMKLSIDKLKQYPEKYMKQVISYELDKDKIMEDIDNVDFARMEKSKPYIKLT